MVSKISLLFFLLLYVTIFISVESRKKIHQVFGVVGRLTCDGFAMEEIKVKAYKVCDHVDKYLNQTYSNHNGVFIISGSIDSSGAIEAKINIYHKCKKGWNICYRKYSFVVPRRFIWRGYKIGRWFRAGQIRMQKRQNWGERDCFN
ncbi:Transthyretin-like family-containing protein [Strongyloides ratti]|uniref:Transthyretin-like family-containing protein n=1 Tax=Strongyloides ratti TaxID=34506 RepID=A0A090LLK8_STRRB|nr:Transthyretin-like family-containing protein [Strongyloides ratti]CEF70605.1 Transthyretin-like family-containing protein [Strongyloides ratti]